jgi:hypothetical protein
VLDALHDTPERLSAEEIYAFFVNIIHSSQPWQLRSDLQKRMVDIRCPQLHRAGECVDAKRVKLEAFREFRSNGIVEKYDKYKEAEAFATVKKRNLSDDVEDG